MARVGTMNQRIRPKGKLVEALMVAASDPCTAKGGWGNRIREAQGLMREAALELAKWNRPSEARRKQPADLFQPRQAAE